MMPLEFPRRTWTALMMDLRQRGQSRRESGAFLLGNICQGVKAVHDWLPYDELDPSSLNYDYVRLSSESFSRLWLTCEQRGLQVVADVHTHPLGPAQSPSDRANPMVSVAGHIALIVPRFATDDVEPTDVSVNIYLGSKRWMSFLGPDTSRFIQIH